MALHLAILYADRGEFDAIFATDWCEHTWRFFSLIAANLMRFSPPIDADTPGDFFRRSRRCGSFENLCDKIAQSDGFALLAIRSNKRRKSRKRAHLANAGELNRRYLTCQISAILYADRGDQRKSQSLHRAHLAIFADRGDRRIKSPSVLLALRFRALPIFKGREPKHVWKIACSELLKVTVKEHASEKSV